MTSKGRPRLDNGVLALALARVLVFASQATVQAYVYGGHRHRRRTLDEDPNGRTVKNPRRRRSRIVDDPIPVAVTTHDVSSWVSAGLIRFAHIVGGGVTQTAQATSREGGFMLRRFAPRFVVATLVALTSAATALSSAMADNTKWGAAVNDPDNRCTNASQGQPIAYLSECTPRDGTQHVLFDFDVPATLKSAMQTELSVEYDAIPGIDHVIDTSLTSNTDVRVRKWDYR